MKQTSSATSGTAGASTEDPLVVLHRLEAELSGVAPDLAPERVPGHRVRDITAALTTLEKHVRGLRLVLRRAAADTGDWRAKGHKSPADQVAKEEGISVGQAKREIEASRRLADMPAARDAAGRGEISPESAAVVAEGAAADPSSEQALVTTARRGDLDATRRRVQDVIAKADERSGARARRIHERRSLKTWVSVDGEGHGHWNVPAEMQARFMAALKPYREAAFRAARAAGEHLADEQLMADALDMLMRDVLAEDARAHPAGPPTTDAPTGSDPTGHEPSPTDAPTPVDDQPGPDAAARRPTQPADPTPADDAARPPRRRRRAPAQVHVLVDFDALRRGYAVPGETCEIHGIGPVPVSLAEHLMQDALLRLVVTGIDITKVTSQRRYVPEALRRALFARDKGRCVACGSDRYLELHHYRTDHARGGPTEYANLAHLCIRHHALATHCGWTLHHTEDGWDLRPPPAGKDPP